MKKKKTHLYSKAIARVGTCLKVIGIELLAKGWDGWIKVIATNLIVFRTRDGNMWVIEIFKKYFTPHYHAIY